MSEEAEIWREMGEMLRTLFLILMSLKVRLFVNIKYELGLRSLGSETSLWKCSQFKDKLNID